MGSISYDMDHIACKASEIFMIKQCSKVDLFKIFSRPKLTDSYFWSKLAFRIKGVYLDNY